MKIAAGTPAYGEDGWLLAETGASVAMLDNWFTFASERECDSDYTESVMREEGFTIARKLDADWYLQLDADEKLVHGEQLRDLLEHYEAVAYPLPYLHEDGWCTLAPFKLVRPRSLRLVAHCDYFRQVGSRVVVCLSGYPCDLNPALLGIPHLLHEPSRRRGTWRRLSAIETQIEARPPDAVQWPLPTIALEAR